MKKKISLLLVVIFVTGILLSSNSFASGNEKTKEEPKKMCELTDLRTEYAKVYKLSDGNKSYEVHANRIHYKDGSGKLEDIDNTILQTDGKDQKEFFKNKANDFKVSFGKSEKKPCVTIKKGEHSIEMSLVDSNNECKFESTNSIPEGQSNYLDDLSKMNNSIQVRGILQDLDAVYTVLNDKVKEDFIIYKKTSLTDLNFIIKCSNLNLVKKTEAMTGYDEDTNEESTLTKDIWYFEDPST
jgi:hypothetical protein